MSVLQCVAFGFVLSVARGRNTVFLQGDKSIRSGTTSQEVLKHHESVSMDRRSSASHAEHWYKKEKVGGTHFKIMGHFNTGTHLMRKLLLRNFGEEVVSVSDPNEEGSSTIDPTGCTFWKHSYLRMLPPEATQPCNRSNIIGIALVRNPISWLDSLHKEPYDLYTCSNGENWLTRTCTYPEDTKMHELRNVTFANVEDIWNNWTMDYESHLSSIFSRSIIVSYEEVVTQPQAVLRKIAALANLRTWWWDWFGGVDEPDRSDKRKTSAEKVLTSSFLANFKPEELDTMCERLNWNAMHRYKHFDCDKLQR
jgi:hypothetical protein